MLKSTYRLGKKIDDTCRQTGPGFPAKLLPRLKRHAGISKIINKAGLNHCSCIKVYAFFIILSSCSGHADRSQNTITIKTMVSMQYDLVRFTVKPGSKIKITLINESDMSHNLVIAKPGSRMEVVNAAQQLAEKAPEMDYIPLVDAVLWSIPVVSPGHTKTVEFTAPSQAGVYPYVCTYPGHGFVMYGAMYVTTDDKLPDITSDINIPESRRQDGAATKKTAMVINRADSSPHPYPLIPPYLYHVFIEGATPAAIAVHLPGDLSYCWDAGTCRLRFAWKGGFVDMSELWKGHVDASAKILGDIFFRDNTAYPIRMGKNTTEPVLKYKGYSLIDRYPEFYYTLNGVDIFELIKPAGNGVGITRDFRIPTARQPVTFFTNRQDDAIEYQFSAGHFGASRLELSPAEARHFTITMTSYYLLYKNRK